MSERIPCEYPAPRRCTVELPGGTFHTREWLPGEARQYTADVLTKPKPTIQSSPVRVARLERAESLGRWARSVS